jgi:hypothetical protein
MADRDMVNHPSHYETGKFECIDVMLETQGYLATLGFCIGNVFKYSYRHGGKNGKEDIEKLGWYRNKYIELLNRREEFLNNSEDIVKDLAKFFPDADELINGPKSDYKSGTSPDIQAIMDDFSKYMNPPVEDKPQVNPDKDGWYDAMHLSLLPGFDIRNRSLIVPEGKVLETMLDNGVSVLWHPGDSIIFGMRVDPNGRMMTANCMLYTVTKARVIDAPESCEGGNE